MVGASISAYHYTDEIIKYCCLWSCCMSPTYIGTYNMSFLNYNRVNVTVTVFLKSSKREEKVTQLTLTCSRSTIETLEKGVKYVQS